MLSLRLALGADESKVLVLSAVACIPACILKLNPDDQSENHIDRAVCKAVLQFHPLKWKGIFHGQATRKSELGQA
jgi:hypothetical protein